MRPLTTVLLLALSRHGVTTQCSTACSNEFVNNCYLFCSEEGCNNYAACRSQVDRGVGPLGSLCVIGCTDTAAMAALLVASPPAAPLAPGSPLATGTIYIEQSSVSQRARSLSPAQLVRVSFTAAGEVADFTSDRTSSIRAWVVQHAGVPLADVTVVVAAASVLVTIEVNARDASETQRIYSFLASSDLAEVSSASSALGIAVLTAPQFTLTAASLPAPEPGVTHVSIWDNLFSFERLFPEGTDPVLLVIGVCAVHQDSLPLTT